MFLMPSDRKTHKTNTIFLISNNWDSKAFLFIKKIIDTTKSDPDLS